MLHSLLNLSLKRQLLPIISSLERLTAFTAANDGTGASDTSPPTPPDSVSDEFYFWDQMIGAKKISSSDVTQVISRRDWSNGTTFDMYKDDYSSLNTSDSGASSLYGSTFYFRTSANRVYKVISNIPPGEFTAPQHLVGQSPPRKALRCLLLVDMS